MKRGLIGVLVLLILLGNVSFVTAQYEPGTPLGGAGAGTEGDKTVAPPVNPDTNKNTVTPGSVSDINSNWLSDLWKNMYDRGTQKLDWLKNAIYEKTRGALGQVCSFLGLKNCPSTTSGTAPKYTPLTQEITLSFNSRGGQGNQGGQGIDSWELDLNINSETVEVGMSNEEYCAQWYAENPDIPCPSLPVGASDDCIAPPSPKMYPNCKLNENGMGYCDQACFFAATYPQQSCWLIENCELGFEGKPSNIVNIHCGVETDTKIIPYLPNSNIYNCYKPTGKYGGWGESCDGQGIAVFNEDLQKYDKVIQGTITCRAHILDLGAGFSQSDIVNMEKPLELEWGAKLRGSLTGEVGTCEIPGGECAGTPSQIELNNFEAPQKVTPSEPTDKPTDGPTDKPTDIPVDKPGEEQPNCHDGKVNHGESDMDCGQVCTAENKLCFNGLSCTKKEDCQSGICTNEKCTAPAENQKIINFNVPSNVRLPIGTKPYSFVYHGKTYTGNYWTAEISFIGTTPEGEFGTPEMGTSWGGVSAILYAGADAAFSPSTIKNTYGNSFNPDAKVNTSDDSINATVRTVASVNGTNITVVDLKVSDDASGNKTITVELTGKDNNGNTVPIGTAKINAEIRPAPSSSKVFVISGIILGSLLAVGLLAWMYFKESASEALQMMTP